ncbi:hypothetical protein DVT68_15885 [Dyella solisilvae]|uniref:Outer membrane lipoprotein Blc n=1 Tax=Dyella solisilvae TaxID=1920168 RepID=A0A370K527_9GAMM|nr:lipocalin family protein [Dyella solisilvae]RDI97755.1 hypothetical protein DVT68_15885 [Dyella solisilvae]
MGQRPLFPLPFVPLPTLACSALSLPNEPVDQVDLARYSGEWHEIAHLPQHFQHHCADRITATYTERTDGTLAMSNACHTCDGGKGHARGVARRLADKPGALRVRYAPAWLAWLPFVWADYWIIELDSEYQWAVVGSPSKKSMWVLSRTPSMSPELFDRLRLRSGLRGYPVDKLVIAGGLD